MLENLPLLEPPSIYCPTLNVPVDVSVAIYPLLVLLGSPPVSPNAVPYHPSLNVLKCSTGLYDDKSGDEYICTEYSSCDKLSSYKY